MKYLKSTCIFSFFIFSLVLNISTLHAETAQQKSNRKKVDTITSEIRTRLKTLKKLSSRSEVKNELYTLSSKYSDLKDGDNDGLSDIFEGISGSKSCNSDSDGDGISDGNESRHGSKPNDSSSGEIELKSLVSAKTATTITVGGYTFTVASSSIFLNGLTLDLINIGDQVEISGKTISGVLTLKKVKKEDSHSGEVELKGNISAMSESSISAGGYTFNVVSSSRFEDGTTLSSYSVGDYVEISGKYVSSVLTLIKIKKED